MKFTKSICEYYRCYITYFQYILCILFVVSIILTGAKHFLFAIYLSLILHWQLKLNSMSYRSTKYSYVYHICYILIYYSIPHFSFIFQHFRITVDQADIKGSVASIIFLYTFYWRYILYISYMSFFFIDFIRVLCLHI